jgi:hypothetical protein
MLTVYLFSLRELEFVLEALEPGIDVEADFPV